MNPQYPGTGGAQPSDGWGRSQSNPQNPDSQSTYETPDEFGNFSSSEAENQCGASSSGGSWANNGEQSPVPGMSAQDFQKLCRSVDKAFSQFSRIVNKGVEEAATALGQTAEKNVRAHKELRQKRKAAMQQAAANRSAAFPSTPSAAQAYNASAVPLANRTIRSSAGLTAAGVVSITCGAVGTVTFGAFTLVGALMGLAADPGGAVTAGIFGALTVGSAILTGFGINRLIKGARLKALRRIMGNREVCTIEEIASRMQVSPAKALSLVRGFLKSGAIPEGRLDDENTTLMVTGNAYHHYLQFKQTQQQALAEAQAKRDAQSALEAEEAARRAEDAARVDGLTPEQRAFIMSGRDLLNQIIQLNQAIDDAAVSKKVSALEEVTARIMARAEEDPQVVDGLSRLNDYYLPTTIKLLAAYDNLEEQPVQGENIASSRREIEHTLDVLHSAFEKLLDDTFQDLSLDVSSDISVLHAMLAQEGLTEGPFDALSADSPTAPDQERKPHE